MAVLAGLQKHWLMCVCLMLIAYSGFYIFMGNRGLHKYFYLQQELKVAQSANENYEQQRKQLSEKVSHFSDESLDLDLREERARTVLNYVEKDEFVILDDTI